MFDEAVPQSARDTLVALTSQSFLPQASYLAGGTALAFQLGHRRSYDLDLFTPTDFNVDGVVESLGRLPDFVIEQLGVGTINARVGATKLSILRYPYPLLALTTEHLGVQLANLLDIGVMKLTAIANRGLRRDFVDLAVLLEHFTLAQLLDARDRKLGPLAGVRIHLLKSLLYFADADADQHPDVLRVNLTWSAVKATIERAVSDLRSEQLR